MVSFSVKVLEKPTDSQIEQAVQLLLRAFEGDVSLKTMTSGNDDLEPLLFRSMLKAGALEGTIYVVTAEDGADDIYSIGVWFGPGQKMFSSQAQLAGGWNEFFAALTDEGRNWWMTIFHQNHEERLNALLGDQYLNGWFANIIGTDPKHQRKGYASAIVRTVSERAKIDGTTVALATQNESNLKWYQSLGFKLLGESIITHPIGNWPDFFVQYSP